MSRRTLLAAAGGLAGAASLNGGLIGIARAQGNPFAASGGMLRLIANENPYGPGPAARAAAQKAVENSSRYAFGETGGLRKLIAAHEGVPADHVMVSAGSSEVLRVAAVAFGSGGGHMVAAKPAFDMLPTYARSLGCAVDDIALDQDMRHDLDAMADAVRDDTRLVYVVNPNNPTGTLVDGETLAAFIDTVSPRAPVLVDEAYLDLWDDLADHTAVPKILEGKPVIVARTFSKLHGMAGLRVGYAIAPPELIKRLEKLRVTVMSYVGVKAAEASLQDEEFLAFSRARIRECLAITSDVFEELGRPYVPSRGNFIYFDTGGSGREFMSGMRSAGILTGNVYEPFASWARVSMGKVEEMQAFADAARTYFG